VFRPSPHGGVVCPSAGDSQRALTTGFLISPKPRGRKAENCSLGGTMSRWMPKGNQALSQEGIPDPQGGCHEKSRSEQCGNRGRLRQATALIVPKNKRTVLPKRSPAAPPKRLSSSVRIRNAHAVSGPMVELNIILQILVKSALEAFVPRLVTKVNCPPSATRSCVGNYWNCSSDAELLDTVRGKRTGLSKHWRVGLTLAR